MNSHSFTYVRNNGKTIHVRKTPQHTQTLTFEILIHFMKFHNRNLDRKLYGNFKDVVCIHTLPQKNPLYVGFHSACLWWHSQIKKKKPLKIVKAHMRVRLSLLESWSIIPCFTMDVHSFISLSYLALSLCTCGSISARRHMIKVDKIFILESPPVGKGSCNTLNEAHHYEMHAL